MLAIFTCGGMLSGYADAQDISPQHKIGVVNLKKVFDDYDKQKEMYAQLKAAKDEAQEPINELSATIEADRKRYEENKDTMTNDEKRDLEELVESNYSLYKSEFQRAQNEIDRKEKKILEELFEDIQKAVEEVGARENYHLIFEGDNQGRPSGVLYFSTTLNMTQKVVEYLNTK
jgi:Skp family chaperone for outer membrane proteins